MKVLEKINLIDKISRELQSRMTYGDIDVYLSAHGIDCKVSTTNINSKYVYSKEILAKVSEEKIIEIATELNISHQYSVAIKKEATCWNPGYFRLFLSHLSAFKKSTSMLQAALKKYGISSFVAHEDIEPSKEWQEEIESALHTMDALVAVLMPGFKESNWCDQEVGVAFGRNVLIIPVMKELNPYGFIGKFQGIQAVGKTIGQVAEEIFQVLIKNPKTKYKAIQALSNAIGRTTNIKEANERLIALSTVESIPSEPLEGLKLLISENSILRENADFIASVNTLLKKNEVGELAVGKPAGEVKWDDDIPF